MSVYTSTEAAHTAATKWLPDNPCTLTRCIIASDHTLGNSAAIMNRHNVGNDTPVARFLQCSQLRSIQREHRMREPHAEGATNKLR